MNVQLKSDIGTPELYDIYLKLTSRPSKRLYKVFYTAQLITLSDIYVYCVYQRQLHEFDL